MSAIKIAMTSHGIGQVWIDGKEVRGVRAIGFSAAVENFNTVTLTLCADQLELQADEADIVQQVEA